MAERLRAAAAGLHGERTNVQYLVDAHGPQVREALLVLLGVLSMCPLPGVGTVAGVAILSMAAVSWRGTGESRLPPRFAAFGLTRTWAIRLLNTLARVHELAAQTHRPKWSGLVDGIPQRSLAVGVGCMGALIALPLPLGNLLPGLALAFVGVGMLRRDGLALLLAAACGLLGAAWPFALALLSLSSLNGLAALFNVT